MRMAKQRREWGTIKEGIQSYHATSTALLSGVCILRAVTLWTPASPSVLTETETNSTYVNLTLPFCLVGRSDSTPLPPSLCHSLTSRYRSFFPPHSPLSTPPVIIRWSASCSTRFNSGSAPEEERVQAFKIKGRMPPLEIFCKENTFRNGLSDQQELKYKIEI